MTYDGYTFMGWYANSQFSGQPVTQIDTTDFGEKTYYAKWDSTDTGVTAVTVRGISGTMSGNTITVWLPYSYGSVRPTHSVDISIALAGSSYFTVPTTADNGATWTFTVTAEDQISTAQYTIYVHIDQVLKDIEEAKSAIENRTWTGTGSCQHGERSKNMD